MNADGSEEKSWQPQILKIAPIQKSGQRVFESVESAKSVVLPLPSAFIRVHLRLNSPPATGDPMARCAILVEKIYEDLELQYPLYRLREAGHTVDVIGPKKGETYVGKHMAV